MIHSPAPIIVLCWLFFPALALPFVRRASARMVHPVALVASGMAFITALYVAAMVVVSGQPVVHYLGGWRPPWGIEFHVDYLSAVMAVLITSLSFLVLLFSKEALGERLTQRSHFYYALYLLFTMGMTGMSMTGDLFNLYVFLEVTALTGYALVAVGDPEAPFAAFRYIVVGTLGASFYLLGLAYLYGMTGSLNFIDVARRLQAYHDSRTAMVALAFLLTGFGIKAALFPLHTWLPDAYSYSPNVTTAFMAAVGTKVGAYGIFRVLYTIYQIGSWPQHLPITSIMGWLAAAGIIVGSVLAIAQTDLKRMLAYSSVSQIGYILLGFSLVNAAGITGAVLHIINHAFMKACLFMVSGAVVLRLGHRDIRRFAGLGKQMPVAMAAFTIAALSMVGLPPTAGFFSKWYLVLGALRAGKWPFVVIILVSSLLNAVYFFRILERVYFTKRLEPTPSDIHPSEIRPLPASIVAPLSITAVGILVLGLGSWPLVQHVVRFIVPAGL